MSNFADNLPTFDVETVKPLFPDESQAARNVAIDLPADMKLVRRSAKRLMLHLMHVKNAAEHLDRLPDVGESFHAVMRGNYHAWDLVPAVLKLAAPATIERLSVATLGFNKSNATELLELFDAGQIIAVDFVCSCYFKSTCANEFGLLHEGLTARGQRIAAVRSHAKILGFELSDGRALIVESSANLRSCHNVEQFTLTHDAELLAFHRQWIGHLLTEGTT